MIIFHILFHVMLAIVQFLSVCLIAFVGSRLFKGTSIN